MRKEKLRRVNLTCNNRCLRTGVCFMRTSRKVYICHVGHFACNELILRGLGKHSAAIETFNKRPMTAARKWNSRDVLCGIPLFSRYNLPATHTHTHVVRSRCFAMRESPLNGIWTSNVTVGYNRRVPKLKMRGRDVLNSLLLIYCCKLITRHYFERLCVVRRVD